MAVPLDPLLYQEAQTTMRALLGGPAAPEFLTNPKKAVDLGVVGMRPSVREVGGVRVPVLILSLDATRYPSLAPGVLSGLLGVFTAGGTVGSSGTRLVLERHGPVRRISVTGPTGPTVASLPTPSYGGRPLRPGLGLATLVADNAGRRLHSVGGTLGAIVRLEHSPTQWSRAILSCSHCIAVTDVSGGPLPARSDWVLHPSPAENLHIYAASTPEENAFARLDRWSGLGDETDVAVAVLRDGLTLERPSVCPYAWPTVTDLACPGESVWLYGASRPEARHGVVDSVGATVFILNHNGTATEYRDLVAFGSDKPSGWMGPATVPGDSGAFVLAWRGGQVAAVGMAIAVGVDDGSSAALSYAHAIDRTFDGVKRITTLKERGGPSSVTPLVRVTLDVPEDLGPLPPPPWFVARIASNTAPTVFLPPEMETPMSDQGCVVYNFHFHAGSGQPRRGVNDAGTARVTSAARTGFMRFDRFRITAGDVSRPSGRRIKTVKVTTTRTDASGNTASQQTTMPMPITPANAPIAMDGRAAMWNTGLPNDGIPFPAFPNKIEIVVTHRAADNSGSDTDTSLVIDRRSDLKEVGSFISEVDVELRKLDNGANRFYAHYGYRTIDGEFRYLDEVGTPV